MHNKAQNNERHMLTLDNHGFQRMTECKSTSRSNEYNAPIQISESKSPSHVNFVQMTNTRAAAQIDLSKEQ
jgi:hypothetical protein